MNTRTSVPSPGYLFCGPGVAVHDLESALATEGITIQPAESLLRGAADADGPTVLLVADPQPAQIEAIENLPDYVVVMAADSAAEDRLAGTAVLSLATISDSRCRLQLLHAAFQLSSDRRACSQAKMERTQARRELAELNRIGASLMTERDHKVLLRRIVELAMRYTTSDAGALFLLERAGDAPPRLRFKVVLSQSVAGLPSLEGEDLPVDSTSMAGHAAMVGAPVFLEDAHNPPAGAPYAVLPWILQRFGYWLKSIMAIPMIDHRGEVTGVLEVANRKSDADARLLSREDAQRYVLPYTEEEVQLGFSLAGQAAVLIENARLYRQVEHLLESFVKASVTAIDKRDPTTAGHSVRVATFVTDLALRLRMSDGRYRDLRFTPSQLRELRFAALLHDFGKVGVDEDVLLKARKLPPVLYERVQARFDLIRTLAEVQYQQKRGQLLSAGADLRSGTEELDAEFGQTLARLDRFQAAICEANEPAPLTERMAEIIDEIATCTFERPDGRIEPYLYADELHFLRIPHGTLDARERNEMEAHPRHTLDFLSQIPWTDDLKAVPVIAARHHEKLNGTGYPDRLAGRDIPVQTRMITIADIFDALTAADRPYKPAVSAETALDILRAEADAGRLDADLVRIVIDSEIYRRVLEEHWTRL